MNGWQICSILILQKIIGSQGSKAAKIEETDGELLIHAEMERKEHDCICLGITADTVRDYRTQ